MLRVYDHYKYFNSYSAGIEFRRQTVTSNVDPRAVRVKPTIGLFVLFPSCSAVNDKWSKTQYFYRISYLISYLIIVHIEIPRCPIENKVGPIELWEKCTLKKLFTT